MYGLNITFYWKGKKLNVIEIYQDAIFLTLNPYDLFVLYDIYFKFYVAAVYYEIMDILNTNKLKTIKKGFEKIKTWTTNFEFKYFPEELHLLIKDIHMLLNRPTKITENTDRWEIDLTSALTKSKTKIDEQMTKFTIEFKRTTVSKKINRGLLKVNIFCFSVAALKVINSGTSSDLKSMKILYLKFRYAFE